jgi:hypothetical protein
MSRRDKKELTLDDVREEVKKFAIAMEERLRENDWKGYLDDVNGWESMSRQKLFNELTFEAVTLSVSIHTRSRPRILTGSVDVANYSMMLFDNESRPKKPTKKDEEPTTT